ncbi:MAG TPA: DinB family protein [Candidatus Eisenbacteria bacterium]|nr:DinB family protein [Candidatus Eisenbacteria bacterium]
MISSTLTKLFEINVHTMRVNTEGITDDEALIQPEPGGNCMNWVIGHILSSREGMLRLLGEPTVLSPEIAERYKRGSAPITKASAAKGDGLPFSKLMEALTTSQERLLRGISKADDAKWSENVPNFGTAREAVHFLHFHEAYHAGQIAILRRMAGKKGAIQ